MEQQLSLFEIPNELRSVTPPSAKQERGAGLVEMITCNTQSLLKRASELNQRLANLRHTHLGEAEDEAEDAVTDGGTESCLGSLPRLRALMKELTDSIENLDWQVTRLEDGL